MHSLAIEGRAGVFWASWAYHLGVGMSLSKLSAGDGYRYLMDQTVSADRLRPEGGSLEDYYVKSGCPDGVWVGQGIGDLGVSGTISGEQMACLFGEGMHPDARAIIAESLAGGKSSSQAIRAAQLGRPFSTYSGQDERLAGAMRFQMQQARTAVGRDLTGAEKQAAARRATDRFLAGRPGGETGRVVRPARQPVAGYDMTFSVPKSYSIAWGLGDDRMRQMIEGWQETAIAATLRYVEDQALFTRRGADGIATLETGGLVAARFRHWDSRDVDPQLHDHVAIANRVKGSDGRWRTIDGAHLYKWKVAASEFYNRVLAEQAHAAGFATRLRDPGSHKQPVVELAGVTDAQIAAFSTRRGAIAARTAALVERYRADHHRAPSRAVRYQLAQQATLETRQPKQRPDTLDQMRARWAGRGVPAPALVPLSPAGPPAIDVDQVAGRIIDQVSRERSTWERSHVEAAVHRWASQQPATVAPERRDQILSAALADHSLAITPATSAPPVPHDPGRPDDQQRFLRSDGTSVYVKPHWTRYTSPAVLAAEDRILAASGELIVGAITGKAMGAAIAAAPSWMDADGLAFARTLGQSDRLLSVGIGPAGTGKTTAMAVMADAAHRSGVRVHALAVAARTAADLGEGIGADTTMSLAAWTHGGRERSGVGGGDLIVIDEAGMVATADLDQVIAQAREAGAQVIAVGDDRQLGPVGAGGALSLVAAQTGAARLSVAHRFEAADEAVASLNLRDGDGSWYVEAGRVAGGDRATMMAQAVEAWAYDRFAGGHTSLLIADTRDDVDHLNQAAQTWLVDHQLLAGDRPTVTLANDARAGVGDDIITLANDRTLIATDGATTVKNRMRWTISAIGADGGLRAIDAGGRHVDLPPSYVAAHVELGYASTNHGAQGMTVDTAHYISAGTGTRAAVYPAMTRGRTSNRAWITTARDEVEAAGMFQAMVARAPEPASAHQMIEAEWAGADRPADIIRAARDMANSYDALRFTIALNQAGLPLKGDPGRAQVYSQLRAGESLGLSSQRLIGLAAADLDPARKPGALEVAAIMAGHLEQARQIAGQPAGAQDRRLAGMSGPDLDRYAAQIDDQLTAAQAALARATGQLSADPRPVTLPDGTVRPSWAERALGRLDDTTLAGQLDAVTAHQHGLAEVTAATQAGLDQATAAWAQVNQPGRRRTPQAAAIAAQVDQARTTLAGLDTVAQQLADQRRQLEAEAGLRQTMTPADRATEALQRTAAGAQTTVALIAGRQDHLQQIETAGPALAAAQTAAGQIAAEKTIRDHTPDLRLAARPRWDHYTPIAGDPYLPAAHGATITAWQQFIDTRLRQVGAAIAINDQRPAWTTTLGRLPDPTAESDLRARWESLAGRIDAYRDLTGWTHPDRPLPPPGQAHTALPTDTTTDLHTLRAAITDLRRDLDRPVEPDLRFRAGMDSRAAALEARGLARTPDTEAGHQPDATSSGPRTAEPAYGPRDRDRRTREPDRMGQPDRQPVRDPGRDEPARRDDRGRDDRHL